IKAGAGVVLGEGTAAVREVFLARCEEVGAARSVVAEAKDIPEPLDTTRFPGYQRKNIACALAATELV
ncbi:MAG TPA: hypothetical protein DEB24_03840, partial [Coriobacteriia bacterium]|nr:hypothetical protein [Coriobacteriia bacterium]